MNDFDDRIGRYLDGQARTIELTPSSPDRAVRRAYQRRARRRLGGVVAVGLAAALIGNQIASDGSGGTVVADQTTAATFDGAALQWQREDPASNAALGYNNGVVVGGDGQLYALSTAPGRSSGDGPVAQALYRSADGVSWGTTGALGDGQWLGSLASHGGTLYAVSTGAALSSGISMSTSTDGGTTWTAHALPIDLAALAAQTDNLYLGGTSVAANDNGLVVAARVSGTVDPAAVLPDDVSAPYGVHATAEGLEIMGPVEDGQPLLSHSQCEAGTVVRLSAAQRAAAGPLYPSTSLPPAAPEADKLAERIAAGERALEGATYGCEWPDGGVSPLADDAVTGPPVQTLSWAELGASDDLRLAATGAVRVFTSADGVTFTEASLPVAVSGWGGNELISTADGGFLLVAQTSDPRGNGPVVAFTSPDGQSWTAQELPTQGWASNVGRLGDRIGVVVQSDQGGAALLLGDGPSWTAVELPGDGGVASAAFGPAGVAVALYSDTEEGRIGGRELLSSADGQTWTRTSFDDLDVSAKASLRHVAVTGSGVVLTFDGTITPGTLTPTQVLVGTMG